MGDGSKTSEAMETMTPLDQLEEALTWLHERLEQAEIRIWCLLAFCILNFAGWSLAFWIAVKP